MVVWNCAGRLHATLFGHTTDGGWYPTGNIVRRRNSILHWCIHTDLCNGNLSYIGWNEVFGLDRCVPRNPDVPDTDNLCSELFPKRGHRWIRKGWKGTMG